MSENFQGQKIKSISPSVTARRSASPWAPAGPPTLPRGQHSSAGPGSTDPLRPGVRSRRPRAGRGGGTRDSAPLRNTAPLSGNGRTTNGSHRKAWQSPATPHPPGETQWPATMARAPAAAPRPRLARRRGERERAPGWEADGRSGPARRTGLGGAGSRAPSLPHRSPAPAAAARSASRARYRLPGNRRAAPSSAPCCSGGRRDAIRPVAARDSPPPRAGAAPGSH